MGHPPGRRGHGAAIQHDCSPLPSHLFQPKPQLVNAHPPGAHGMGERRRHHARWLARRHRGRRCSGPRMGRGARHVRHDPGGPQRQHTQRGVWRGVCVRAILCACALDTRVWDVARATCVMTLEGHSDNIRSVVPWARVRVVQCVGVLQTQPGSLLCLNRGGMGRVWRSLGHPACLPPSFSLTHPNLGHPHVQVMTNKGRFVITASDDCTARVWDLHANTSISKVDSHTARVRGVRACSPLDLLQRSNVGSHAACAPGLAWIVVAHKCSFKNTDTHTCTHAHTHTHTHTRARR